MFKALIADLDNTIYPVKSIGDRLFKPLVDLMEQYKDELDEEQILQIKEEMMKKPWQKVADEHKMNHELKQKGTELLKHLTYELPMQSYDEYQYMQKIQAEKFLVTTGFFKLQQSKVKQLELEKDFKEIFIVDPETTDKTKQDIFREILSRYNLKPADVLAIGDDPESEIKAAKALGIPTYLFDEKGNYPPHSADYQYNTLSHLPELFN